jgi:G3E family GTPase
VDWDSLTEEDLRVISEAGYEETAFEKSFSMDENSFSSMFFMNISIPTGQVLANIERLWKDREAGNVIRIKGFLADDPGKNTWIEVNSTRKGTRIDRIPKGQEILIVIGEGLKEDVIDAYFPAKYSTTHVR